MEYQKLGNISEMRYGRLFDKNRLCEHGKYPVFSGYRVVGYCDECNIDKQELIVIARGVGGTGDVKLSPGACFLTNLSIAVILDEKVALKEYLYYYFQINSLRYLDSGSAQSQITIADLKNVIVPLPQLEQQHRIIDVLQRFDQKIEVNYRINDNLRQQAHTIYHNWFIEYEPFGGFVPSDWNIGRLKDILQIQKRTTKAGTNPELPYLPIDMIPMRTFSVTDFRANKEAQSSLIKFCKDDIVIGAMRVYFHRVVLAPCDGITRTTCFTLKPIHPAYLSYALLTCDLDSTIEYAQKTSKGSTMPYAVWGGGMGEIELVIPSATVLKEFNKIVLPMLRQIQQNCSEIRALQSMRDILLPKLMSGEINVSDVQL